MKKYNYVSPMGFKLEKNNQKSLHRDTASENMQYTFIYSSNIISSLHMVCVLTQLYAYGTEHLSPGKNSNYINAANMAPLICHHSHGLNLIVTRVLSLQQLPSTGKANHQKVAPDSVVNVKYTEIYLAGTSLISSV